MRIPVNARVTMGRCGHFYVNPASVDVCGCGLLSGEGTMVRLTRRQIEAALALMNQVRG
jgi:hypothetical protein